MTTTSMEAQSPPSTDDELRAAAYGRLKTRRDFGAHMLAYALVNAMLWAIWAATDFGGFPWPIFPTLGWGIGVVFHAWDAFFRKPITEEEIRREMERLR